MALRTKRVYDPPSRDDGERLLVMRLWPRGVRKDAVDAWQKELAPSVELLRDYQSGRVEWREFARRYRAEMRGQRELIAGLARRARRRTITLLCGCRDESRCHRTLLKKLVESRDGWGQGQPSC
jgi:uncharacterized protein YeaO (DUF488 family)